jgi:type II secretory pathway component PulL
MFFRIEKKELDLLAAYNRKEKATQQSSQLKLILIPFTLIILSLLIILNLVIINKKVQRNIDDVVSQNEEIQKEIDTYDTSIYQKYLTMQETNNAIKKIDAYIETLPEMTKDKINLLKTNLLSTMEIKTITYDQTSSQVSVSYTSHSVTNIEKYVATIRKISSFKDIDYKGYQSVSNTIVTNTGEYDSETGQAITSSYTENYYTFSLTITIDGGE